MIKIKILSIGKTKEDWLENGIAEYVKRLQGTIQIECLWVKNNEQLIAAARKESMIVALDVEGRMMTSEEFTPFFYRKVEQGGARLTFVIGGAEGLPLELKTQSELISLSRLTFTHQLARLVLIEQIYRATEIAKGSGYHK